MKQLILAKMRKFLLPAFLSLAVVTSLILVSIVGSSIFNAGSALGYGYGGGGGAPTPTPTTEPTPVASTPVVVTPSATTGSVILGDTVTNGVFNQPVTIIASEGNLQLDIIEGASGTYPDENNQTQPITEIIVQEIEPNTLPPESIVDQPNVILPYNFGPDGATFTEPVTITFQLSPDQLSGVDINNLTIGFWNETTGAWVELTGVNVIQNADGTYTISGQTDHFTFFAVIEKTVTTPTTTAPVPTATTPAPTQTTVPAPTQTTTIPEPTQTLVPQPTATSTPTPYTPLAERLPFNWTVVYIVLGIAVVLAIFIPLYLHYRRD